MFPTLKQLHKKNKNKNKKNHVKLFFDDMKKFLCGVLMSF